MIDLSYYRDEDETYDDYEERLFLYKDRYGLTWDDIATLLNEASGCCFRADTYRKRYSRRKPYRNIPIVDMNGDGDVDMDDAAMLLEQQLVDLRKERYRAMDERNQINALVRRASREDTIKDIASEAVATLSKYKPLEFPRSVKRISDRDAILLLSDWHYGICIQNRFNSYNTAICRDRVQDLYTQTYDKCKANNIENLYIANLGDMIAGNIHLPLRINSQVDVITQIMEVSEILCEFINKLSQDFNIKYCSVLDNHSRIDPNKKESIQLESLARITDWYIKFRFENNKNFVFLDNEYGFDIATFNIKDFRVVCTHGDKDKPKNIIEKLSLYTQEHYDLVCSAHLHHPQVQSDNNTIFMSNGSLMGTDDYAANLRLNSKPSQTLITLTDDMKLDGIYILELD